MNVSTLQTPASSRSWGSSTPVTTPLQDALSRIAARECVLGLPAANFMLSIAADQLAAAVAATGRRAYGVKHAAPPRGTPR